MYDVFSFKYYGMTVDDLGVWSTYEIEKPYLFEILAKDITIAQEHYLKFFPNVFINKDWERTMGECCWEISNSEVALLLRICKGDLFSRTKFQVVDSNYDDNYLMWESVLRKLDEHDVDIVYYEEPYDVIKKLEDRNELLSDDPLPLGN